MRKFALALLASSIVCTAAHASDTKASNSATSQKPLVFQAEKKPEPCTDGSVTTKPNGGISFCDGGVWVTPDGDVSLQKLVAKMNALQAQTLAVQMQILSRLDQLVAIESQKTMLQGAVK